MRNRTLKTSTWAWGLLLLWTLIIISSNLWNDYQVKSLLLDQARAELRANFFKDQTFRMWSTKHGGVYVPVTETQKPDPYVEFIPERDVVTPSGKILTLINPALMVRQFNELAKEKFGSEGHLSSLTPINPSNSADAWEAQAYPLFKKGIKEITAISPINEQPYLRLIRPMYMDTPCLKCHAIQGYKKGDLGGSVSVSVPLLPIEKIMSHERFSLLIGHLLLWMLGVGGIFVGHRQLSRRINEQEDVFHKLEENRGRTRSIVSSSLDAIITIDRHGYVTGWNEQATTIFGWHEDEIIGQLLSKTIIPERYQHAHDHGVARATNNTDINPLNRRMEVVGQNKAKEELHLELSIVQISIEDEIAFSAFIRDISEQKLTQEKIKQDYISQQLIASVLEISLKPISFEQRLDQILQQILAVPWLALQSRGSVFIVGDDKESLDMVTQYGMSEEAVLSCESIKFGDCLCGQVAHSKEVIFKDCIDHDHHKKFTSMEEHGHYCLPILSGDDLIGVLNLYLNYGHQRSAEEIALLSSVSHTIGSMIQRNKAEESLLHNAFHDPLTGLPNRNLFMEQLKHNISRLSRNPKSLFAVLFLDLDRFKFINDSLGHSVGDQLLIDVSKRLKKCSRPEDTVARLGGDEFTILLEDVSSELEVSQIANRIHKILRKPFELDEREVFSSCSIGVAFGNLNYSIPEEIIRDADTAMYRAKTMSGAQTVYFDEQMHTESLRRLTIDTNLRRAFENHELRVYYQPIVSADSAKILGFEALARWPLNDGSMISPVEFIPIAEETGLINELGLWILYEACRQLLEWKKNFPQYKHLYVSVNVSGKQLLQDDLFDTVETILNGLEFNSEDIRLEITESNLMANTSDNSALLNRFKERGYRFYIDDFGTGYSSLNYLHSFPFDSLKIDRSFVNNLEHGNEHVNMIETIIAIAHNFNMDVIAEGIETEHQHQQLRNLGCERLQGFLFSKPLPANEALDLLNKNTPSSP
ncbi:MAG: EAL domain-containing protein [Chromatiales bacterium]|nr:EAL domain-containing protein [Chromatiales bacterium]